MLRVAAFFVTGGLLGSVAALPSQAQPRDDFVPVGVRYQPAADATTRQRDLETIRRFRFNVVMLPQNAGAGMELILIDRLLGGAPDARIRRTEIAELSIGAQDPASSVRLKAWTQLAGGARGVIFGDWASLVQNSDALAAAAEFAEHISRNAALFAPMRPASTKSLPGPNIAGRDSKIAATFLESPTAILLVVTNHDGSQPHEVTMTFAPDTPEAIWQNMLTGATVSFVTGPNGPTYTRTLEANGVLVLMIGKELRNP